MCGLYLSYQVEEKTKKNLLAHRGPDQLTSA